MPKFRDAQRHLSRAAQNIGSMRTYWLQFEVFTARIPALIPQMGQRGANFTVLAHAQSVHTGLCVRI
jgi:hypothetical protein